MMAYANPANRKDERQRGDGFGIARFNKLDQTVTFEAWPRFADVSDGDSAQYSGWPVTVKQRDNDGRQPVGWLPEIVCRENLRPVIQVVDESTDEILYTVRSAENSFRPPVYTPGKYTIRIGIDKPDQVTLPDKMPLSGDSADTITVEIHKQ